MTTKSATILGLCVLLGFSFDRPARAEDSFWGDTFTRPSLAAGWNGRDKAAERGVRFDASLTQVVQSVVDGGKDDDWEYGGRANLTLNVDTQKLGLWPGGFLTVEFESNWADSVNGNTGALLPANFNQLFPVPTGDNVALPQLSFAQFLSHYAGVVIGKLDLMLGDGNEFAHGKGDIQFFNTGFSINPVLLVVPYTPLGTGVIVLPTKDPKQAIVNFVAVQAKGKSTQSGFDEFSSDNWIFTGEGRVRTNFFGLTGHQVVGALYSNAQYTSIDQRLGFVIENRELVKKRDTWAVYYNFDQFLYELDKEAGRGLGLFGRFGASEGNPIPIEYFVSAGVGGKGMLSSRPLDRFGIGFYYSDINNPTLQRPFFTTSFLEDEWGFEAFYNFALTPWLLLTPDIQVVNGAQRQRLVGLSQREDIDTATILGFRLQLLI